MTPSFATMDADIRLAGSTEYSALAFLIDLIYKVNKNVIQLSCHGF